MSTYLIQRFNYGHDTNGNSRHACIVSHVESWDSTDQRGKSIIRRDAPEKVVIIGSESAVDDVVRYCTAIGAVQIPGWRGTGADLRDLRDAMNYQREHGGHRAGTAYLHGHEVPEVGGRMHAWIAQCQLRTNELARSTR